MSSRHDASAIDDRPPVPRYLDGDLSLLRDVTRFMARAEDDSVPVLERLRALHCSGRTLDDFFQARTPRLEERVEGRGAPAGGLRPTAVAPEVRCRVEALYERQSRLFSRELMQRLAAARVHVVEAGCLSRKDAAYLARYFRESVFPVLTPLAVDPGHPFLHVSRLSLNLAVIVRHPLSGREQLACLRVPPLLPRFVALPDGERFLPLEWVVATNLRALFPGMEIVSHAAFRLTGDGDLDRPVPRVGSLPATIQAALARPRRRARAVRLEINPDMPDEVRNQLVRETLLTPGDVYVVNGLLDLGSVDFFEGLDRPELESKPHSRRQARQIGASPMQAFNGRGDHGMNRSRSS
jgi:polyphosphate kinase